jgi:hypothetical protein
MRSSAAGFCRPVVSTLGIFCMSTAKTRARVRLESAEQKLRALLSGDPSVGTDRDRKTGAMLCERGPRPL